MRDGVTDAMGDTSGVIGLELASILGALSHGLDLVEGQPLGHSVRCCYIGMRIGDVIGLSPAELSDLFYTVLLKDLGCSSNAARICQLYLTDDRIFKRDVKTINTASLTQAVRFILNHTGLKAGLLERFQAIVSTSLRTNAIANELIETRCHQGADIAKRMRFSDEVADGIRNLDEHWSGTGQPRGRAGADIPIASRIALLAQVVDVFHTTGGRTTSVREVLLRSGTWLDPELVQYFVLLSRDEKFWTDLGSPDLEGLVYGLDPARRQVVVEEDYLDDIAAGFAQVVDAKSPYTNGHSERVTLYTDAIASELGLDPYHRRWLRRAALLHDIGKLSISNLVLDKKGPLDDAEWSEMRQHPAHSARIVARVPAFEQLVPVVEGHHERLDGKGYPRGLSGTEISLETRIVTVADIFDALTSDRPYRAAVSVPDALVAMAATVGTAIDGECYEALRRALVRMARRTPAAEAASVAASSGS